MIAARRVDPGDLRDLVRRAVDAIDGDGGAGTDADRVRQEPLPRLPARGPGRHRRVPRQGVRRDRHDRARRHASQAPPGRRHAGPGPREQADALVEICRQSLAHDHTKPSQPAPRPPAPERRGRPPRASRADHPDLVADIRAEAEHVGLTLPHHARTARRVIARSAGSSPTDPARSSTSAAPPGTSPTSSGKRSSPATDTANTRL